MARSKSTKSQYRRKGRANRNEQALGAGRLAALAGGAGERAMVEPLEPRQMLFSLTVTADDINPQTGIGQVRAVFGYYIPMLATTVQIQDPQPAQIEVEDFDDEEMNNVGSGARMLGSGLQILHNITPAPNIRIAPPAGQDVTARWLRVDFERAGEFFALRFATEAGGAPADIAVTTASFAIRAEPGSGSPIGLNTDTATLELRLGNQIVATYTGAALRALIAGPNAAQGVGVYNLAPVAPFAAFDEVRIISNTGVNPAFQLDDVNYTIPQGRFVQQIEGRAFGVEVLLAGPVGASASFFDLYNRPMVRTIALISAQGQGLVPYDADDNGVPERNDGIGSVRLNGFDSRSSITMIGGTLDFGAPPPEDADFVQGGYYFQRIEDVVGLYDNFEGAGFGYVAAFNGNPQATVHGLPPGPGSLIIGSPFIRDNSSSAAYNPTGLIPGVGRVVTTGFTRADQGIFADGGQNAGSIYVHGIVHGSSRFSGYVDRFYAGYMVGSVSVEGDAGKIVSGTDSGSWSPDPGGPIDPGVQVPAITKTAGQIVVGRTLGEYIVGGRGLADVTVVGDVNSPSTRPAKDIFNYYELEYVFGQDPDNSEPESTLQALVNNTQVRGRLPSEVFRTGDVPPIVGSSYFRNDTILGAEWIGSAGSGVRIKGDLSGRDSTNGEDAVDVYAFAADGTQDIVLQGTSTQPLYFRVMDENGRTLAAPESPVGTGRFQISETRFRPNAPGVYYIAVTDPEGVEDGFGTTTYTLAVLGMAPVAFGAYRTAAGSGFGDLQTQLGNSVSVLAGGMGSVRVGTGYVIGDSSDQDASETLNTTQTTDDVMSFSGGTFNVAATLYNITTGGDIGTPGGRGQNFVGFFVGGDLGSMITGLSPLTGGPSSQSGDVNLLGLSVGGRIGWIDIRGGVGNDQDNDDPRGRTGPDTFNIITGTRGGPGDIGFIRVGWHVGGDAMNITTSPGSTIGAILVSQDAYEDGNRRSGIYEGQRGIRINSGAGSDVRFVDTPRLDLNVTLDAFRPIVGGGFLDFVDDAGSRVRISVENVPQGVQVGTVRSMPIDGSQGVAIGQISVDLSNGANLVIEGSNPGGAGIVGIGRIVLTGGSIASNISIRGSVEVDVYRIVGAAINGILNQTPGGDIVSIDVAGLNTLEITRGNLGRTQVPVWGPKLIGPYLGVAAGVDNAVGGALGVVAGPQLDEDFNGGIYRPLLDDDFSDGNAYFDDIGSPLDGYLNGLVVRDGNLVSVRVGGQVGDVILQGGEGILGELVANTDRLTPFGGFDGIVGHVYAQDILTIDLGDGLVKQARNPMASSGIFAGDDILNVMASSTTGAVVSGAIIAGNSLDPDLDPNQVNGIQRLSLTNASVIDATIVASTLDWFWGGFRYTNDNRALGDIGQISLQGTNVFRTKISARNMETFALNNGFFDASVIRILADVNSISAAGFRNTTLTGGLLEQRANVISVGRDLRTLSAGVGDIVDLTVDVAGRVVTGITARHIVRTTIDVDNRIERITLTGDLRASEVTAGEAPQIVAANMTATTLAISGALVNLTLSNSIINSDINVTGPDGRIDLISAVNAISGRISASGPIANVRVSAGDLAAQITTTTSRGNVGTLFASRDVNIRADVSGTLDTITAGRHIGSRTQPGVILVRGDLRNATATGGQLYNDLRVGGNITGTISLSSAINKPGNDQVGRGSIIAAGRISGVVANGDFGGDIISYSGGIASVAITNGSFLPGRTIAAYDGELTSVVITNGSLFGNIHADFDLKLLRVAGTAGGPFGHVGINPALSQAVVVDATRNQLPTGVSQGLGFQGPRISAGFNIVNVTITTGDVYEAGFAAGRAINALTIGGKVRNDDVTSGVGNFFVAGDNIDSITINGSVDNAAFVAGVASLGADKRPGGTGLNADTIGQGSINTVVIRGGVTNTTFSAGITAGADGVYNTGDDRVALGRSSINTLTLSGTVANVSAFGDILSASVAGDSRLVRNGPGLPSVNAALSTGTPTGTSFSGAQTFALSGGPSVTITVTGPGQFWFDSATRRLAAHNTTTATNITVASSTGTIDAFKLYTNDDASLGNVSIQSALTGDSNILVDGNVTTLSVGAFNGTGSIVIGGSVGTATYASLNGGYFSASTATTIRVNGDFGNANANITGEARIDVGSAQSIVITGAARALVNVARDLDTLTVNGAAERALFRVGNSLVGLSLGSMRQSIFSAGDRIGTVTIGGEMFDSSILAGTDLGADAFFGGTSEFLVDRPTAGSIGNVTIAGNMRESDIVAGFQRGPDGFFGSSDDTVSPGRSTIGNVTITGQLSGSVRSSENYRIAAAGTIGIVRSGGAVIGGSVGNFSIESALLAPAAIQVTNLAVNVSSRVYTATLTLNQPLDSSTIASALSVYEVRGTGNVEIRLINGVDYTVSYQTGGNLLNVVFSRTITERNLPQVSGVPGPGVYRFKLSQDLLGGKLRGVKVDGNGDGFAQPGESYSDDTIVGDAGDKLTAGRVTVGTGAQARTVDFYAPTNLDIVFDNNYSPDGLPDANRVYTIRGAIGDHADNDINTFGFSGDVDVYSITLQAGQILRLGALQGAALLTPLQLVDPNGNVVPVVTNSATASSMHTQPADGVTLSSPQAYLIKQTGVYLLTVDNTGGAYTDPTSVSNLSPVPGGMGDYNFTVEIFDDGDTGFNASTNAGNGRVVVTAPTPISFAGADQIFGTADDVFEIVIGDYVFTHNRGADGLPNTLDDLVAGLTPDGATSLRYGSGRTESSLGAAIGPAGHAGRPKDVYSDIDVFHLNNRQVITPGTKMRITVRLTALGADLGSPTIDAAIIDGGIGQARQGAGQSDNRGAVQFGLFDTTSSVGLDDALLVFSPTDFSPNGGTPNTTLASNASSTYGYDAQGDFFIEFIVPDRMGLPGAAGTFAIYMQGVNNTDYQLEIVTDGTGSITKQAQNVFIETLGGSVNWLQVGNVATTITPFNPRVLGFQGMASNGQDVQTYILSNLIASLNALYQGAGFDVRFSTNPTDFEFQPFSTVFLSSDADPITPMFNPFESFNLDPTQFFLSTEPYGYSQRSDPFNTSLEDEAVVFAPSFALLGLTPSQADTDAFVKSLTASVSRRVGELMGLRITDSNGAVAANFDPMASDSPINRPPAGRSYALSNAGRALSNPFDTVTRSDFFLGRQNSVSLLDKVLGRI